MWNVENNPPPDDAERMARSEAVAELVEIVLSRPNSTIYKRVILFPDR